MRRRECLLFVLFLGSLRALALEPACQAPYRALDPAAEGVALFEQADAFLKALQTMSGPVYLAAREAQRKADAQRRAPQTAEGGGRLPLPLVPTDDSPFSLGGHLVGELPAGVPATDAVWGLAGEIRRMENALAFARAFASAQAILADNNELLQPPGGLPREEYGKILRSMMGMSLLPLLHKEGYVPHTALTSAQKRGLVKVAQWYYRYHIGEPPGPAEAARMAQLNEQVHALFPAMNRLIFEKMESPSPERLTAIEKELSGYEARRAEVEGQIARLGEQQRQRRHRAAGAFPLQDGDVAALFPALFSGEKAVSGAMEGIDPSARCCAGGCPNCPFRMLKLRGGAPLAHPADPAKVPVEVRPLAEAQVWLRANFPELNIGEGGRAMPWGI